MTIRALPIFPLKLTHNLFVYFLHNLIKQAAARIFMIWAAVSLYGFGKPNRGMIIHYGSGLKSQMFTMILLLQRNLFFLSSSSVFRWRHSSVLFKALAEITPVAITD